MTDKEQAEVLGVGKAKLYRAKKITLRDLLDQSGRPQTLQDLQRQTDPYFIEPKVDTRALKGARFQPHKLKRKIKHHSDFDGDAVSQKAENIHAFQQSIISHLNDKNTIERGYYAQVKGSKVCYNKETNIAVIFDKDNIFVTTYKPNAESGQLEVYLRTGKLR